ncbi:MAG: UDP-galactopyranose mutase [Bacillota bacterium]|nr:UDP-galactopyranose mutase [Bacillota bacterium]
MPARSEVPQRYDVLIVGAGLAGATFAWYARQSGLRVLVLEVTGRLGGLAASERRLGIDVHLWGPHIFHASDPDVIRLARSTSDFVPTRHSPVALYQGLTYSLPPNLWTMRQLWGVATPEEAKARWESERIPPPAGVDHFESRGRWQLGTTIYETIFRHYSEKQWGRPCTELPGSLLERTGIRFSYDNRYFRDVFEGVPADGYSAWVGRLLAGCDVRLNCDFFQDPAGFAAAAPLRLYTGPIDRFFDYRHGRLGWRSLEFRHEVHEGSRNVQGTAVINHCDASTPLTRSTEPAHFDPEGVRKRQEAAGLNCSILMHETPVAAGADRMPCYPELDAANRARAELYRSAAAARPGWLFAGRLAEYRYLNMDQVILGSLELAKRHLGPLPTTSTTGDLS